MNGDQIQATYQDGVLTVKLPKPEEAKPKRITIEHKKTPDIIEA